MVATIDGKTVSSTRDKPINLGSRTDYAVMRSLELKADAVIIGAGTLRSTPKLRFPSSLKRIVVSKSGNLDPKHPFFAEAPEQAFVSTDAKLEGFQVIPADLHEMLAFLRTRLKVQYLNCEGGSELNAALLPLDVVDEIFLTVAPKIKLGRETPTIAGGEPLAQEDIQRYELIEHHQVESELFLRYRRNWTEL